MSEKEKKGLMSSVEDMVTGEFADKVKDFVGPMIKPAISKLEKFLGEDEKMIIIRKPKDADGVVVVVDTNNIESFKLKGKKYISFSMKEFADIISSGNIEEKLKDL